MSKIFPMKDPWVKPLEVGQNFVQSGDGIIKHNSYLIFSFFSIKYDFTYRILLSHFIHFSCSILSVRIWMYDVQWKN